MSVSVDMNHLSGLIVKVLVIAVAVILLLNIFAIIFYFNGFLDNEIGYKIFKKLYMDFESNLPSFFNTILFLISSLLLYSVFYLKKKSGCSRKYYWLVLSLIFLFLSLDENASVHEFFNNITKLGIGGQGFLFFAWVIPYSVLVLVFVVSFGKFLLSLNRGITAGFVLSGCIFLTGAIGVEMISAKVVSLVGTNNIKYAFLATTEETLEMTGLILFIYFILKVIRTDFPSFTVKFE